MGRAPCCEKIGLKKGPWTPEEDQILISYVHRFGHGNWRALPKQAGLLRCGKSCRLRWMNYLRPDIKRGNFTNEEEEMIIKLHQVLGNRWSTIAEKLPGRTDNEIKNVWHTHLKKRLHLNVNDNPSPNIHHSDNNRKCQVAEVEYWSKLVDAPKRESELENGSSSSVSPQYSTNTDLSTTSVVAATSTTTATTTTVTSDSYYVPELPSEDFWTHILSSNVTFSMPNEGAFEPDLVCPIDQVPEYEAANAHGFGIGDERDFWCNLMSKMGEFPELLEMEGINYE